MKNGINEDKMDLIIKTRLNLREIPTNKLIELASEIRKELKQRC